jgi:hypothetical protein
MIQDSLVLQIPVRLAPPIFVDDIGVRNTADWPEPPHRIADRQQSIGMDAGRQPESGLGFLLELQVQRRQSRAKPERSRCEQQYSAPQDDFLGSGIALALPDFRCR